MSENEATLKDKAVNGLKWSVVDNLANSGITFLVGLLLARLLSPAEFGILGIITIFINLSNTIIDGGFATALIRKQDATEADYNTVFYCNLLISLCLMILLCFGSSWIARFFEQPILAEVMPWMSLLLLINAAAIIQRTLLIKRIDFKTQAKISLIASVGSGVVGIGLALAGYGVWSLVGQQLSRQVLLTLFLWMFNAWRPQWRFSSDSFRDLFGFGSKVLVANLINSLYKDMFLAVVGKIYSAKDLGQYNRAEQFNLILTNNLTAVLQKVSMPTFSQVQDDKARLKYAFRKTAMYSAMITFSLVFGLAAVAEPLLMILVGEQWMPAVTYLQIMCLYGAIYPLQVLNVNILNVVKRSDLLLRLEILKKILFIPVIATGFFFELKYMIWAAVIYYDIEFICNSWYSKRFLDYGTWQQIKDYLPIGIVSLLVSAAVWCFTLLSWPYWIMLLVQLVAAVIMYLGIYELWKPIEYVELKTLIAKELHRRKI